MCDNETSFCRDSSRTKGNICISSFGTVAARKDEGCEAAQFHNGTNGWSSRAAGLLKLPQRMPNNNLHLYSKVLVAHTTTGEKRPIPVCQRLEWEYPVTLNMSSLSFGTGPNDHLLVQEQQQQQQQAPPNGFNGSTVHTR
ncbi:uncharacterized protein LOC133393917 [Anopheles gambiae]|uniref:uncharacterized protein LOC133393917 n=1 Tax=Anopheles gambiae TaxID=7165 RepID=UPI002AC9DB4F|nr:uncharacterized protein LOC133393917 [Anopheles gambiae]